MDSGVYGTRERVLTRLRYSFLTCLVVITLALTPFRPLKISGQSMEPTLHDGETYLLDHFYWRSSGVRRGDIVVVNHGEEKWVKRLLGMPGDHLQIVYTPTGRIAMVANLTVAPQLRRVGPNVEDRQVKPDEIFVVGDNLNQSTDSKNREAGAFELRDIVGVVRTFTMRRDFPVARHL